MLKRSVHHGHTSHVTPCREPDEDGESSSEEEGEEEEGAAAKAKKVSTHAILHSHTNTHPQIPPTHTHMCTATEEGNKGGH